MKWSHLMAFNRLWPNQLVHEKSGLSWVWLLGEAVAILFRLLGFNSSILRRFVCKMSFYLLRVYLWCDPRLGFCGVVLAYAHCCLCVWMVVAVAGSGLTAPDNGPIKGLQSWSVSGAGVSVSARHVPVLKSNYRLSWNWALGTRDRNEHLRNFHNPKVSPF